MDIVVLAGGLSTERDVSFKTGSMVTKALRENGHQVILLDVFMGYSDKEGYNNLLFLMDEASNLSGGIEDDMESMSKDDFCINNWIYKPINRDGVCDYNIKIPEYSIKCPVCGYETNIAQIGEA